MRDLIPFINNKAGQYFRANSEPDQRRIVEGMESPDKSTLSIDIKHPVPLQKSSTFHFSEASMLKMSLIILYKALV